MSILLFSLRNVPDDEAYEIKELLDQHAIEFYETYNGNWGISMPALWLRNAEQLALAQQLLSDYHQQRYLTQRQLYLNKQQGGNHQTFFTNLWQHPLRFITYTLCALLILMASTQLIKDMGHQKNHAANSHGSTTR